MKIKYSVDRFQTHSPSGSIHNRFVVRDQTGKKVTKEILKSIKSRKIVFENNTAIYDKKTVDTIKNVLQIK